MTVVVAACRQELQGPLQFYGVCMRGVRLSEVSRRDFGLPHVDAMVGWLAGAASVAWGPLQQGGEHRCWTHALGLRVPAEKDPGRCLLQGRGMCWCCMGRGQVGKGAGAAGTETGSEKSILDEESRVQNSRGAHGAFASPLGLWETGRHVETATCRVVTWTLRSRRGVERDRADGLDAGCFGMGCGISQARVLL